MPRLRSAVIITWVKSWQTPRLSLKASRGVVSTVVAFGSYVKSLWISAQIAVAIWRIVMPGLAMPRA